MIFKDSSNRTVYLIHQVDAFAHHTCMKCHLICACICRRMFPSIVFSLNGLEPTGFYDIYFEIVPASNYCFKFINNKWRAIGEAETEFKNTPYKHPESPRCGSEWMSKTISFQDVKLSNKHGEDNSIVGPYPYYCAPISAFYWLLMCKLLTYTGGEYVQYPLIHPFINFE